MFQTGKNFYIKKIKPFENQTVELEAPPRFELGIRVLQTHALPLGYSAILWSGLRGSNSLPPPWQGGALPDELNPHILATWMGVEPTTSSVTG